MKRLTDYLFVRHSHNWIQLFRFGLVGGSGVLVNLVVAVLCHKLGPTEHDVAIDLPLTQFNVRFYHVYSTIAFLVANVWNFQLNRLWTFKSAKHASWAREYWPFLTIGLAGQVVGLILITVLIKPESPLALPAWFDDSSGLRTRFYWAQLISIVVVTPLSFLFNKLWTFAAVRGRKPPAPEHASKDEAGVA